MYLKMMRGIKRSVKEKKRARFLLKFSLNPGFASLDVELVTFKGSNRWHACNLRLRPRISPYKEKFSLVQLLRMKVALEVVWRY